ncbi:MAG: DUF4065 domain-containing protein [Bacteroidales bacterium]|nr:DUF4065 domain-containing protein [Bacteroidales bacterium]
MVPKKMASPITGTMMPLMWEDRDVVFRKETFHVIFPYYKCTDTGEQFTTTESDGVWYRQMTNQYCRKYGIPYQDEIIDIRKRYGLSASAMSKILGFGANQWRKYEQEEIPSVSNGRMIRSIMNPKIMMDMVECARECLEEKEYKRLAGHVKSMIDKEDANRIKQYDMERVFASTRGEENGYGQLSLVRLKNVMLYILNRCADVWTTKMNKILFYIDFVSYRELGTSITGLSYRAIEYGPVPERWDRVYSQFDEIHQVPRSVGDYEGCVMVCSDKADESVFSSEELLVMEHVCQILGTYSSRQLSDLSHKEKGWIEHHKSHQLIPYVDAFTLKGI